MHLIVIQSDLKSYSPYEVKRTPCLHPNLDICIEPLSWTDPFFPVKD